MTEAEFDRKIAHVGGQLKKLTVDEALAVLGYCGAIHLARLPAARAEPLLRSFVEGLRGAAMDLRLRQPEDPTA